MSFTHLHVHSIHSIRDALCSIEGLVNKALKIGFDSLAITEHGNLNSLYEFYNICNKKKIKPIFGAEFYLANKSIKNKEPIKEIFEVKNKNVYNYHILLLAINKKGFTNLKILNKIAWLDGFYRKPRIDLKLLKQYNEGIICSTACIGGWPQSMILIDRYDLATKAIEKLLDIFGNRLYLEVQNHGMPEQQKVIDYVQLLSNEHGIPVIATNDIHYLEKDDSKIHKMLMAKQFQKTLAEYEKEDTRFGEEYMKSELEMKLMIEKQEWLNETTNLSNRIEEYNILYESNQRFFFPKFNIETSEIKI